MTGSVTLAPSLMTQESPCRVHVNTNIPSVWLLLDLNSPHQWSLVYLYPASVQAGGKWDLGGGRGGV